MRQFEGRETWHRLLNWDKGQTASERLAAQILIYEKYNSIDPSHPLGGRDGLKDIVCIKGDYKYIAAAYFSRGQDTLQSIKSKFIHDLNGIEKNSVDGIIFVTNQELRLSERDELINLVPADKQVDIFHLERIASILNSTINYGIRLEFLDIEMTKEEQLSYMAAKDSLIIELKNYLMQLNQRLPESVKESYSEPPITVTPEYIEKEVSLFSQKQSCHKCSHCGYGYKVLEQGINSLLSTSSYSTSSRIDPLGFNSKKLISCPKCGNTEEYYNFR